MGVSGFQRIWLCTCIRTAPHATMPFSDICGPRKALGKFVLSSLQSRTRSWGEVGRRISVRSDRRNQTAAKVSGATHLLLPPVRGLSRHGPAAGRRPQRCAWQMIRDLVSSDPALNQAAWEALRRIEGLLTANGNGCHRASGNGYLEF